MQYSQRLARYACRACACQRQPGHFIGEWRSHLSKYASNLIQGYRESNDWAAQNTTMEFHFTMIGKLGSRMMCEQPHTSFALNSPDQGRHVGSSRTGQVAVSSRASSFVLRNVVHFSSGCRQRNTAEMLNGGGSGAPPVRVLQVLVCNYHCELCPHLVQQQVGRSPALSAA